MDKQGLQMRENDSHTYSSAFFDYTDRGARRSAKQFVDLLVPLLELKSIADFGCGRGTWLREWSSAGVEDIVGVDGEYVVRSELNIDEERFQAYDITQPLDLGRRFDLVQSLEVAEHLPKEAAETFINTLTSHGNRVLFSAAVPGQGGEFHVNEQPLDYWRGLFEARGYAPFDFIRPRLFRDSNVQRWYRFNSILFINEAGAVGLPNEILNARVKEGIPLEDYSDLAWKVRCAIFRQLSPSVVNLMSKKRAEFIAKNAARHASR